MDGEGRATPSFGAHVNRATESRDVTSYHIHAHTTPRDLADRLRGTETWLEDQVIYLLIRHGFLRADQAACHGLVHDRVVLQPGTIIADLNDNRAPLMIGVEMQQTDFRLPSGEPCVWPLDAVVEGITYQMYEGIAHLFQHCF